jgi:hypothetical protein
VIVIDSQPVVALSALFRLATDRALATLVLVKTLVVRGLEAVAIADRVLAVLVRICFAPGRLVFGVIPALAFGVLNAPPAVVRVPTRNASLAFLLEFATANAWVRARRVTHGATRSTSK